MLTFPWYPKELNPNSSCHYHEKAKKKAIYKDICFWTTKEAKIQKGDYRELSIVFYKPNRRWMDLDNMLASIKSGLDGMCLALEMDDRCFTKITVEIGQEIAGMIKIEIK
jgi:Holliday junction resolvase RusA-like endonuclease